MDYCTVFRIRKYVLIGSIVFLFIAILPLQQAINYSRETDEITEPMVIMPGEFVTNFVIGGFKGVAADILWIKIEELWHGGKWFEIMPLLRAITWMQPHFIEAWELGGWHLADNLYAYAREMTDKERYIEEGIRFLKEGIAKNRDVYNLYFELGWIYYSKLNKYDEGVKYFKSATRYKHPSHIDRLIAHAYRKAGNIEAEYKQWQYCLTIFQNDSYHIEIVKKHLEIAKRKLEELGKQIQ